jgi:hypothetical protein
MTILRGRHSSPTTPATNFICKAVRIWAKLFGNELFKGCRIPSILDMIFGSCVLEEFATYFYPSLAYVVVSFPE